MKEYFQNLMRLGVSEDALVVAPYDPTNLYMEVPTRMQLEHWWAKHGGHTARALEALNTWMQQRNDALKRSEDDPHNFGVEFAIWKLADVLVGLISLREFLADPLVPDDWKQDDRLKELVRQARRRLLLLGGTVLLKAGGWRAAWSSAW